MELLLLLILVVVAIIQMRILKTEAGKVSARTVFDRGLIGPKELTNLFYWSFASYSKRVLG